MQYFIWFELFETLLIGYHSAAMVTLNNRPCMLVFGGIHDGASIAALEVYDLVHNTWRSGTVFNYNTMILQLLYNYIMNL